MRKFARCTLILIVVLILGGVGGYIYGNKVLEPTYTSEAELYVVPGADMEASLRNKDGGLNDDFAAVITNTAVINDAKRNVRTSENISKYIRVFTPGNSNIVKVVCINPDSGTAKKYVDAVVDSAAKNMNTVIPVESVSVLSYGTVQSEPNKPDMIFYVVGIGVISALVCLLIEIIVLLCISAFKKNADESDDELDYERNYGKYALFSQDDVKVLKAAIMGTATAKTDGEKETNEKSNAGPNAESGIDTDETSEEQAEEVIPDKQANAEANNTKDNFDDVLHGKESYKEDEAQSENQSEEAVHEVAATDEYNGADETEEADAVDDDEKSDADDDDDDQDDDDEDDGAEEDDEPQQEKEMVLSSRKHVTIIGRIEK